MKTINPTKDQFEALLEYPDGKPFVMVNLLKFKPVTESGETGRTVYQRYMMNTAPKLENAGGRVVWAGTASQVFIGTPEKGWDWILIVEYPSRSAFFSMVSDPEYAVIHEDREAGLEDSVLMVCESLF